MDDVHGTHRTAGIVENPLLLGVQILGADLLLEFGDNVVDDGTRVLAMGVDGALREIVQMLGFEDVELLQARVEEAVHAGEHGEEEGEKAEGADGETAAARPLGAGGGGLRGFGRHDWREGERGVSEGKKGKKGVK
jgi:hypothetical protein